MSAAYWLTAQGYDIDRVVEKAAIELEGTYSIPFQNARPAWRFEQRIPAQLPARKAYSPEGEPGFDFPQRGDFGLLRINGVMEYPLIFLIQPSMGLF